MNRSCTIVKEVIERSLFVKSTGILAGGMSATERPVSLVTRSWAPRSDYRRRLRVGSLFTEEVVSLLDETSQMAEGKGHLRVDCPLYNLDITSRSSAIAGCSCQLVMNKRSTAGDQLFSGESS